MVANAHLVAALSNAPFMEFPYDPPEWSIERRDFMMARKYPAKKGCLDLGKEPGLGITYDEALLAKTRVA
jgi:L-alanine-DL-glutamate epimerase-like enolase superfamily enzyme